MKKTPLQVYLEENLHKRIRLAAKKKKVSQSELVRKYLYEGLIKDLAHEDPALI
jgi:predicted HicB family RNase H-like nuclease